jgi:AAHS family 3-hydroxyphenylpropionic acid transporter
LKTSPRSSAQRVRTVVAVCSAVALFEGLDIQSMGVAAPRLAPAFRLDPGQMGFVMSASTLGLMLGAALGGWLSDRIGRKAVLIVSMAALAVFSLATTIAPDFDSLLGVRVLAIRGTGIGAAIAVGRIGSIAGPVLAGALLAHGFGPGAVPIASAPGLVIAFAAALVLYVRYGPDSS